MIIKITIMITLTTIIMIIIIIIIIVKANKEDLKLSCTNAIQIIDKKYYWQYKDKFNNIYYLV